jgi:O-antigen ligase
MLSPFISLALWISCVVYGLALAVRLPWALRRIRAMQAPQRLAGLAALLMLLGVQVWFPRAGGSDGGLSSLQSKVQLVFLFSAGVLLAWVLASFPMRRPREWLGIAFVALYAIFGIMSAAGSHAFFFSTYKASILFLDVALFFALTCYHDRPPDPLLLLRVVLMTIATLVVLAGANVLFDPETSLIMIGGALGVQLMPQLPLLHPNMLGFLAAITIIFSWSQLWRGGRLVCVALYGAQLISALVVFFLAQSRTAMLGLSLALVIGACTSHKRWLYALVGVFSASTVLACFAVWRPTVVDSYADGIYAYVRRGTTGEQWTTLSGRTELWEGGWRMVQDAPLFGHGFAAGARFSAGYDLLATNLHNGHIEVLVNTGLLGYLAWLGFFGVGCMALLIRIRQIQLGVIDRQEHLPFLRMLRLILLLTVIKTFASATLVQHDAAFMLLVGALAYSSLVGLPSEIRHSMRPRRGQDAHLIRARSPKGQAGTPTKRGSNLRQLRTSCRW